MTSTSFSLCAQMLQVLSELKLTAVLQGSCFWVAVDAATTSLLDRCCTGQQDGGPATAREVANIVQAWQVGRQRGFQGATKSGG